MSSTEEIARRLLARCDKIQESKRKIIESVNLQAENDENFSDIEVCKKQLEQCRRTLMSSQENARLKQENYQTEISDLKTQIQLLQQTNNFIEKERKQWTIEKMDLQRKALQASSWAQKAQKHLVEVHDENVRLKKFISTLDKDKTTNLFDENGDLKIMKEVDSSKAQQSIDRPAIRMFQNLGSRLLANRDKSNHTDIKISNPAKPKPMHEVTLVSNERKQKQLPEKSDDHSIGSLTDETASIGASM